MSTLIKDRIKKDLADPEMIKLFSEMTAKEIAYRWKCTPSYVYKILDDNDIIFDKLNWWSDTEEEILIANRKGSSLDELSVLIGDGKTKKQIINKMAAKKLGGFLSDDCVHVSSVIKQMGFVETKSRIARWEKLGLNIEHKKLTDKYVCKIAKVEELIEFLKNNQYLWNAKNVKVGFLNIYDDWLIKKIEEDKVKEEPMKNSWSNEEKYKMFLMRQQGYTFSEIGKVFDAPANSVGTNIFKLKKNTPIEFITTDNLKSLLTENFKLMLDYFEEREFTIYQNISSRKKEYVRVSDLNSFINNSLDDGNEKKLVKQIIKRD